MSDTQDGILDTAPPLQGGARNNSTSLRRALSILFHLAAGTAPHTGLTLIELTAALASNRSTVLRLLAPLVETRLVERDPGTGRYGLGARNDQLGQVYLERLDRRRVAHEVLVELVEQCGEISRRLGAAR